MLEYVAKEVSDICTPRRRQTKGKAQDDPKSNVSHLLARVEKACAASKMPEKCCKRDCWRKFSPKEIMYRRMHLAAKQYRRRNNDLSTLVQHCRLDSGERRDDYDWIADKVVVCRTFFLYFHNIGSTKLQNVCNDTKSMSGLISAQNVHGNWQKKRSRKGRQNCADWMQTLFATVAQPRPNSTICREGKTRAKEFLPTAIFSTFGSVYEHYVQTFDGEKGRPASFATFRRAWLQHHFQVTHCK